METHKIVADSQVNEIKLMLNVLTKKVSEALTRDINHGLLRGLAGHLLFLYNAHKLDQTLVDEAFFFEKIELLQEHLDVQSFDLSNGLAGQAWVLEYLNQSESSDYDSELLEDVDLLFIKALSHHGAWLGEIEMALGLGGFAPYAARRARFTDQTALYSKLVTGFASTATYFENGQITWSQPRDSVYRFEKKDRTSQEYNLGLAHGVPGIIAALLPAINIPTLKDQVYQLLVGSCDWLLANQNPNFTDNACFGSCADDDHNSRLGWCYGDVTIALTVARVGLALDKKNYVERALGIARHAAKRDVKSAYIKDAGICHGFFGLVNIFQLLNMLMPHPELRKAAQNWLQYGLDKYKEEGVKSLYSYNGIEEVYSEDFGFLMGYSGIGLVLVSALTDDVGWTDCLLMA